MTPTIASILVASALAAGPVPARLPDEKAAWPAATTTDFKLTVELVAKGTKDSKGVVTIADKTALTVRLKAEKDSEAVLYWIDPKGQVVQLFPNRFDRDGRLKAGVERTVPGKREYELESFPTEGEGFESLRVVAVTGPMPASPKGEAAGPFIAFRTEADRKDVVRAVRGVVVREKPVAGALAVEVAQAELRFRVTR